MKILLLFFVSSFLFSQPVSQTKIDCIKDDFCKHGMSGIYGNTDDRSLVKNAEYQKHFSPIGKIYRRNGNVHSSCTGTIFKISPEHPSQYVITAAHCLFDHGLNDMAEPHNIEFIPNFGMIGMSFHIYKAEKIFFDQDYLDSLQKHRRSIPTADWAVIKLRSIVSETKNYATLKPVLSASANRIVSLGYPGYQNYRYVEARRLYKSEGLALCSPEVKLLKLSSEMTPGQSGGPVLLESELRRNKLTIIGLNSLTSKYENLITEIPDEDFNSALTISKKVFTNISNWIKSEEI